jgi:hypothetical protein
MPWLMRLTPTETAVRATFLLMRPHPWSASPSALPRLWLSGQAPCAEAPPVSTTLPLSKRRTCTFVSRHLLRAEIDFDEFVTVMSRKVNTSYTPAQVKAAFKVFEKDAPNGFVTMAALEQALTTYGTEKLSLSDAQELLSQIEPDENGLINYVEFVNMMTSS